MVEEIEKKKKNKEEGREEKRRRSKWSVGLSLALLVLSVAIVISWSTAGPKIGSFTRTGGDKPCSCSKVKRDYSGIVEDCCCDYETVDHLNEDVLHPLLQDLVKTPFFRYFKLQLQRNEVIALMNLLNRLSESIKFVHETAFSAEIRPTAASSP